MALGDDEWADAERELVQWKKVRFITDKVGDEFEGYVTGVSAFGLFIELVEHFVEGMVHVSTMADDYYRFVDKAHLLRGEKNGCVYRLGDKVRVQVIRVDLERRQIDLGLAEILMKNVSVAILDEPTSGLDPQATTELLDNIRSLKSEGVAVLLSSHLLERVQSICDRVALFNRGQIALMGTVPELARQVAEVSLGPDRAVRVHRVVCAIDCGFVVNPNLVAQQVESAVVFGLTAALREDVTSTSLSNEAALQNAPNGDRASGTFVVPKVIG